MKSSHPLFTLGVHQGVVHCGCALFRLDRICENGKHSSSASAKQLWRPELFPISDLKNYANFHVLESLRFWMPTMVLISFWGCRWGKGFGIFDGWASGAGDSRYDIPQLFFVCSVMLSCAPFCLRKNGRAPSCRRMFDLLVLAYFTFEKCPLWVWYFNIKVFSSE